MQERIWNKSVGVVLCKMESINEVERKTANVYSLVEKREVNLRV